MNLTHIRYFIEVARCESFSEAAETLFTAQPNLSKQIARMERELGYPLFVRGHHSLQLTPAGQYLYEQLADLPDRLDEVFRYAENLANRKSTRLSVGILEGQQISGPVHERFQTILARYPQLDLHLERNSFRNLRSGLVSGQYDLIITMDFDLDGQDIFFSVPVFSLLPAIAIPAAHPLSKRQTLTLPELRSEQFVVIAPEESPGGYAVFVRQCQQAGFTPKIAETPTSLESLLLYVELGRGVALLDQNTPLNYSAAVRTIPISGHPMMFSAAARNNDDRPLVQYALSVLSNRSGG